MSPHVVLSPPCWLEGSEPRQKDGERWDGLERNQNRGCLQAQTLRWYNTKQNNKRKVDVNWWAAEALPSITSQLLLLLLLQQACCGAPSYYCKWQSEWPAVLLWTGHAQSKWILVSPLITMLWNPQHRKEKNNWLKAGKEVEKHFLTLPPLTVLTKSSSSQSASQCVCECI